jgi:predicted nucleotide-binding protein
MYSLFVSHLAEGLITSVVEMSKWRFLEYTGSTISEQLGSLSLEAIESIKSWPCILMQEGKGQEVAYIVKINDIKADGGDIKLIVEPIPGNKPLLNDEVWKLRGELDIEQFEFNRNHWAIKDRDLFHALAKSGYFFGASDAAKFQNKPLPAPTRRDLLNARDVISELSHTEIDDFLLEAGVNGLNASRAIGSRRDRANAIIQYAIANPMANTAENSLLSAHIVRVAASSRRPSESSQGLETHGGATDEAVTTPFNIKTDNRIPNRVFIVHGQNETARTSVVSALTRFGLEAIVLHEQPNMGRHLLTKFIEEAELVTFAIILMTDDDVGGIKGGGALAPRARQNVILELGYFLSHLGQKRVCALITPGLETPSDFDGIVYIRMDDARKWESELLRELRAAEMPIVI